MHKKIGTEKFPVCLCEWCLLLDLVVLNVQFYAQQFAMCNHLPGLKSAGSGGWHCEVLRCAVASQLREVFLSSVSSACGASAQGASAPDSYRAGFADRLASLFGPGVPTTAGCRPA
jgi:hypothetical protein